MKIALFNTVSPFIRGGAEILAEDLYRELRKRGHEVILFRIPFPRDYEIGLLNTVISVLNLDFSDYDKVISFKFPAYCVVHRHSTLWMFHQFRQVYELFGMEYGFQDDSNGRAMKEIIRQIDNTCISRAERVFTNAEETSKRLYKYNELYGTVLNPPQQDADLYYFESYGDYVYYPARIDRMKRQHLAVEAMKYTKSAARLIIDGQCAEEQYLKEMCSFIKKNKIEEKVEIHNQWVSDEIKRERLANCLAVVYLPYKEDSMGFTTMEGFYSHKPVIGCTDSGGLGEFIENGMNGFLSEPSAEKLAMYIDLLFEDSTKAEKMGRYAYQYIIKRNITWDETIRRLLN